MRGSRRKSLAAAVLAVALTACGLAVVGTGQEQPVDGGGAPRGQADVVLNAEGSTSSRDGGTQTDGGQTDGSGVDGSDAHASSYDCNGAPVSSCAACGGQPSLCAGTNTCVTECSTDCAGSRIACFRCDAVTGAVTGTCQAENDAGYCVNDDYAPGVACPCGKGDAAVCPGDFQKCVRESDASPYACHSCGEAVTAGGPNCKNGKQCDFGGSAADHLTCH